MSAWQLAQGAEAPGTEGAASEAEGERPPSARADEAPVTTTTIAAARRDVIYGSVCGSEGIVQTSWSFGRFAFWAAKTAIVARASSGA